MILPPDRRRALTAKAQKYAGQLEPALPYLLARGITKEAAQIFSLGYVNEGEYRGRLAIPYLTPAGVVTIKYRCIVHDDCKAFDCVKYLTESGCGTHLYNAHVLIHNNDTIVITEGELDAVTVQAYAGIPAVAYPGVDTWQKQPHYRLCFEGVSEVIVVADGDKPGREAAKRVSESIGMSARVVDLGTGEDANSFIARQGSGLFLERLSQ